MAYSIVDIGTGFLAEILASLLGVICTWELLACLLSVNYSERESQLNVPRQFNINRGIYQTEHLLFIWCFAAEGSPPAEYK